MVLIALLCMGFAYSQKFELGKVAVKELEEKRHPIDTSAIAAVLYNKFRTYFVYKKKSGFSAVHEFEIRIKIYKKEGLEYANYEVPYRIGYEELNDDMLSFSDAATYNLVDGKIEKTKLNNEGSFVEKVNKKWRIKAITLPNVKEGAVIEFKYTLKSENILTFPTFIFQKNIPVNFAEYKTDTPVYYIYKPVLKGLISIQTTNAITTGYQNVDNSVTMQTDAFSYSQVSSIHAAKDIPALKEENYTDNIENYRSAIDYELERIRMPDVPDKDLSVTWEGVAKTIYSDEDFGPPIKTRNYFEEDLRRILQGLESQEDKMKAIFNFVKNKMNWNDGYGIYADKGVKKAYIDRTGNVAEINFILIAMLNSAAITANPVLVSTIENGIAAFPNITAFNYVIAAAEINGKRYLLDASNKFTEPNILPINTLNWNGRLIKNDGNSESISMVPASPSKINIIVIATIGKDGKITGKARIQKNDYDAFVFRKHYAGMNRDSYLEKLENEYDGIQIKNYVSENEDQLDKPMLETFEFNSDSHTETIGDNLYISPMLFFSMGHNPFTQEERKLPIYFGYPAQKKMQLSFDIPDGYVIASMPKPLSLSTGENVGNFKYNIQALQNKIQITVTFDISEMLVSSAFYPILKEFYKKMIDKQAEKIILKKI